jgi:hypothetical protein
MNQTSQVALPHTKLVVEGLRPSDLLPLEIVHRILEYDGRIKYRNGKYMNQISPDDDRYAMLQNMPLIQPFNKNNNNFWSIFIFTDNKIICLYKSLSYYLDDKPCIVDKVHNESKVHYCSITRQGICHSWTIEKKSINSPSDKID